MDDPSPLRLQPRDIRFLTELGEVLLLDSKTIFQRYYKDEPSGKSMLRRLGRMRAHGLIETVCLRVALAERPKLHTVYRLTPAGAEYLEALTGLPPVRLPRVDPPKEATLFHRAEVARLVLTVNDACIDQQLPKPEWILEQDTIEDASPTDHPSRRFVLYEVFTTPESQVVTCRPDASCHIRIPEEADDGTTLWGDLLIYWEYDRSTEVHKQVLAKMDGYNALLSQQGHRRHWKYLSPERQEAVRIFVVLKSAERLDNLRKSLKGEPGTDALRLTTVVELEPGTANSDAAKPNAGRLLTEQIWQDIRGKRYCILQPPTGRQ